MSICLGARGDSGTLACLRPQCTTLNVAILPLNLYQLKHGQTSDFTIGFIGLGNLGEPLCNSLVTKGCRVTVTDLNKASAQRLLDAGATLVR